jgi:uncharacterized protein YjiS (DUF1127 family)
LIVSIKAIRFTDCGCWRITTLPIDPFQEATPMSDLMMPRFAPLRRSAERPAARQVIPSLRVMLRAYLTRRALLELTPREFADIGVSTAAAVNEAARLPWDINRGDINRGDTDTGPRRRSGGFMQAIQRALHRARTRHLLAQLGARELSDFGASPSDAHMEASKPFWRA